MTAKVVEVLIMEAVALFLFWLAYMIGVKNRMELIAGYNEKSADRVADKKGLARLIARTCYLVAIASALMPVATSFAVSNAREMMLWIGAYGGYIAGVVALTVLQARDFTKRK